VRILLAGGGTGGHVFPALAIGRELAERGVAVEFVGTARGIEATRVPAAGFPLHCLHVEPMKGGGAKRVVRGAWIASRATASSLALLRRLRPDAVLSVGGYAAGPISLAAALTRIPLAVYEPNAMPGLTNRMLRPLCKRAFVVWPEAERAFGASRARKWGVPLRAEFTARKKEVDVAAHPYGTPLRVLVLGGSQGASSLNREAPKALADLPVSIVHQCGKNDEEQVRAAYRELRPKGPSIDVRPFIEDVALELLQADLVIARAGASSVAELCAIGKAAILVPFPFAADNHQEHNARSLEKQGACICLLDSELATLSAAVRGLCQDEAKRRSLAENASRAFAPDATARIATELIALARLHLR
jgi:UDP-N-acetylglucosamine--N-acetylmuramyl-(pentapeptide) pyrophosphoryl-undecaprenol N-acetylglucosamine transferase